MSKFEVTIHVAQYGGMFLWIGRDLSDREYEGLREAREAVENVESEVYAALPEEWLDRAEHGLTREGYRDDPAPRVGFVEVIDPSTAKIETEIALDGDAVDAMTSTRVSRERGEWK